MKQFLISRDSILDHPIYRWESGADLPLSRRWKRPAFLSCVIGVGLIVFNLALLRFRPPHFRILAILSGYLGPLLSYAWMEWWIGGRILHARQCGFLQEVCITGRDPFATLAGMIYGGRGRSFFYFHGAAFVLSIYIYFAPTSGIAWSTSRFSVALFIIGGAMAAALLWGGLRIHNDQHWTLQTSTVGWILLSRSPEERILRYFPIAFSSIAYPFLLFGINRTGRMGPILPAAIIYGGMFFQQHLNRRLDRLQKMDFKELIERWFCMEPLDDILHRRNSGMVSSKTSNTELHK